MFQQRGLLVPVERATQVGVHQHHIAADRQHAARISPCLLQIGCQKCRLALMSHRAHAILNVATGAGSQREQQRIGSVGETAQIDGADESARQRITDR
ncbi:hypothetical protein [Mycobacterium marseillense]|uniref:hypothetical protein n=1 Tax=Mycobacterium marseillense TaxID=701042 RepID=UPI0035560043